MVMFKTDGNDVTDTTIYKPLWTCSTACTSNEFRITHDHVKNTIHMDCSKASFRTILHWRFGWESKDIVCFLQRHQYSECAHVSATFTLVTSSSLTEQSYSMWNYNIFIFFKTISKGHICHFLEVKNQKKNVTDKCSL